MYLHGVKVHYLGILYSYPSGVKYERGRGEMVLGKAKTRGIQRKGKERQFRITEMQALFEGSESPFLSHDCLLVLFLAKCLEKEMLVIL